ncbi:MAG: ribulose-phosphate 3-epimerase [Oscillospiraceae bacterium]|jgi:ribulose-phosphate 3-epimerase|nr:ribulose-phosphate 3-epimerase [Oscillospiraceae bacterium]
MKLKFSPSILASDFAHLAEEAQRMEQAGADYLHIDVMDGHFVPNITLGPPVIRSLRPCCSLPFDVHLMISHPLAYLERFAQAGADLITVHVECEDDVGETLGQIKALGCQPGLTLRPATPIEAVFPYLEQVGMVLVMTVEPGFGGQPFRPDMLPKIQTLRQRLDSLGLETDIQVDGGIGTPTIASVCQAGANVIVAGSSLFGKEDYRAALQGLRALGEAAMPSPAR